MSEEPLGRLGRRTELLEQAAEVSRAGLRTRRNRVLSTARPILQSAVAAALAWLVATEVVGHDQAFFAPIAALITLGLTVGERIQRAVEIAIGVAVGIAVADALVAAIGSGTWQIAVVVGLAMLAATLIGGGPLLASQAGVSAVLVATLQPPDGGFDFNRFLDALVGGGVALVVGTLVLPVNPLRLVRESTGPLLDQLAATMEEIGGALEARDAAAADAALAAVGHVDALHDRMHAAFEAAGDAARLSPGRRGTLRALERYAVAAGELGLAVENVRALARGVIRAINLDDAVPPEAVEAIRALADSARTLGAYLEGGDSAPAREAATRAAGLANSVLEETSNLSAVNIVGQVRMAAVDLLRAAGLERSDAQQAVRTATRRAIAAER
jgi:Fusaric acid resistance protein-like